MRTRLQLVVAHPADETFGCGSLLLHAAAAGARTVVTCATRGEAGERELAPAAEALGVEHVELLDFADSGTSGDAGPRTLVGAAYDDVVASVLASVQRHAPDVLVTLDAGDGHRDHVRIRDAALEAAREAGVRRVYVSYLGTPDDLVTTRLDARVHREAREKAMALHASQASPFEGLPDNVRDDLLDVVHARRVTPPWAGGPREATLVLGPGWWDHTQARWVP